MGCAKECNYEGFRECSTLVGTVVDAGLKDKLIKWLRSIVEKPFVKRAELNTGGSPSVPGVSAGRGDREEGADAEWVDQKES